MIDWTAIRDATVVISAFLDRASRLVVVGSTAAAIAVQVWLGQEAWNPLEIVVVLSFALALFLAVSRPTIAHWLVLGSTYVFGVPVILAFGRHDHFFFSIWFAALFALILGTTKLRGWSLPPAWRTSIALYSLAVGLTWPIIVAREADFSVRFLFDVRSVTSSGGPASVQALWTTTTAASQLLGVLWLDAMYVPANEPRRFIRLVIWPLGASALVTLAVALYQMSIDMTFLNTTIYGGLERATGTMRDANAYAVIAAMWIAGFIVLAWRSPSAFVRRGLTLVVLLSALAVLGTGSRTGLLAAAVAGLGGLVLQLKAWTRPGFQRSAYAALALLLLAGIFVLASQSTAVGPLRRVEQTFAGTEFTEILSRLWERDGYGTTAHYLISRYPLTGVGLGAFHALVLDYDWIAANRDLVSDNAQNWFRQLLVELGALGVLGIVSWAVLFVIFAARPSADESGPRRVILCGLAGLMLASLFGVPTQRAAVLITFWTFVAWYSVEKGSPPKIPWLYSRWTWLLVWSLALTLMFATASVAWSRLRVPYRALDVGWSYSAGYVSSDRPGTDRFQWAETRAVAVLPVTPGYLVLKFWVRPDRLSGGPVRVRFWRKDRLVVDMTIDDQNVRTIHIPVLPEETWMMLESEAGRPAPVSQDDAAGDLWLGVAPWEVVETLPAGAMVVR